MPKNRASEFRRTKVGVYPNKSPTLVPLKSEAQIVYDDGDYATLMLPTEVRILKFCTADVCAKDREKHQNEGFVHVF